MAGKVAQYKVHILIEKPLATTLEDGQAIIDSCRQKGVKLYYGASYRNFVQPEQVPEIAQSLLNLGYLVPDVQAILGGNHMRIARQVWK